MKHVLLLALLAFGFRTASAHGGDDHAAAKAATPAAVAYFSAEALSDKYEVLMKYGELRAGIAGTWQLFLSDANSNHAVDARSLSVKVAGQPNLVVQAVRTDTGIYRLSGSFPANGGYDLQVSISAAAGPDLLQVSRIEVGKKLAPAAGEDDHHHWYEAPWLWAVLGLLAGGGLVWLLMRRRSRRITGAVMVALLLVPTAAFNPSAAHGGDDHGGGKGGGALSNAFVVEKEAQFLFGIGTQKVGGGSFYQSRELAGTVSAAPQGRAVIQAPQAGTIRSLRVTPGQRVRAGQVLALVEQQVEAGTQINIISQRNTLQAEVKAARAQYDRLQSIADIAAKKDVTEAKARYESALQNLKLFNANVGRSSGSTRMIELRAPISGVVGTFNYAIGAVVNSGETLFEITNLERVFVETQLFGSASDSGALGGRFVAFAGSDTTAYALRLVAAAQEVNPGNQAQRVLFEVLRPAGNFRIGENVRVLHYGTDRIAQLVVPAGALTDIGGRPAVFIKDRAEGYSVSFVKKGESNALYTAIASGVEAGERVVTENVYQMKMIYLGQ